MFHHFRAGKFVRNGTMAHFRQSNYTFHAVKFVNWFVPFRQIFGPTVLHPNIGMYTFFASIVNGPGNVRPYTVTSSAPFQAVVQRTKVD